MSEETVVLYAIVSQLERPGKWSLVGIYTEGMGHMACVSPNRSLVEELFEFVSPETKMKGAKIVKLIEVEQCH